MAGDPFKKVTSGEPLKIPARAYNAFIDAAIARQQELTSGAPGGSEPRSLTIAKVRNNSGSPRARFEILALGQPLIGPNVNLIEFQRSPMFSGESPMPGQAFCVLLEPLAAGAIGNAAVAGVVPVRIMANGYEYADVLAGNYQQLVSVPHGPARVLWSDSSGWGLIRFDEGDREEVVLITSNVPDANGYYDAVVQRFIAGAWVSLFACKALDMNR